MGPNNCQGFCVETGHVHGITRSEEHTSELQSQSNLVCRLLLEQKVMNATQALLTPPLGPRENPSGTGNARLPMGNYANFESPLRGNSYSELKIPQCNRESTDRF